MNGIKILVPRNMCYKMVASCVPLWGVDWLYTGGKQQEGHMSYVQGRWPDYIGCSWYNVCLTKFDVVKVTLILLPNMAFSYLITARSKPYVTKWKAKQGPSFHFDGKFCNTCMKYIAR